MIPVLYDDLRLTRGVIPEDAGDCQLIDCTECFVTEKRNESYELELTYPFDGRFVDEIQIRRLLLVKANAKDPYQLFRIYKITKELNGYLKVYAQHISYDLSKASIIPSSSNVAHNCTDACTLLSTTVFTITTDISSTADFVVTKPSSKRSWIGGQDGCLLDVYGGELYYDNFNISLLKKRGQNKNIYIQYGNNLTALNQELDGSALAPKIRLFYQKSDGTVIRSNEVSTGATFDFIGTTYIDVTSEYDAPPTVSTLNTHAQDYVQQHPELYEPVENIDCNFVQQSILTEDQLGLCDTVRLIYPKFGINIQLKIIELTYDVLYEKYTNIVVGEPKKSYITDPSFSSKESSFSAEQYFNNFNTKKIIIEDNSNLEVGVIDGNTHFVDFYDTSGNNRIHMDMNTGLIVSKDANGINGVRINGNNRNITFHDTNNKERLRIQAGAGRVECKNSSEVRNIRLDGDDGSVTCVSLTQTSTRKVKKNIEPLSEQEAKKILDIEPVKYDFIDEAQGLNRRGFIAEDVDKYIPAVVRRNEETGEAESLAYTELIPHLTKMIQIQQKQIEELQNEIDELKENN